MKKILLSAMFLYTTTLSVYAQKSIPLVYENENSHTSFKLTQKTDFDNLPAISTLPDPFAWTDGKGRSTSFKDWKRHRAEIMEQIQYYEVGMKPVVKKDQIKADIINDTLIADVTVGSETLQLKSYIKYPKGDGPFPAVIGIGMGSGSLPSSIFEERDIAQITFNFQQVMAHTQKRGQEPINRLYPEQTDMGAYSAWPWGVSRIIDALEILGAKSKIDMKHIAITGCSFAGKMALFSGAFDERIALVIAQEPGGGGVDAWRVSETLGKVETLGRTSHEWFMESMFRFAEKNVNKLPIDHHELAALIAPRALLVLGNTDYEWLADESNYISCHAARKVWETFGIAERMGFSIEGGHMHCQLPKSQYPEVEAFVDRFLLDKENVDTNIMRADMFKDVDYMRWIPWAK